MQLNEWREKDASEQRFLIHQELVSLNDRLRLIHDTAVAIRKVAERPATTPPPTGSVDDALLPDMKPEQA